MITQINLLGSLLLSLDTIVAHLFFPFICIVFLSYLLLLLYNGYDRFHKLSEKLQSIRHNALLPDHIIVRIFHYLPGMLGIIPLQQFPCLWLNAV